MAVNTFNLLVLERELSKALGDWLEFDTTTDIAASTDYLLSTELRSYDGAEAGAFDDWWVYITEGVNIGVERKTGSTAYSTATGKLYVYGANLAAESAAVTCRLHRYERSKKKDALLSAVREIYPTLHLPLEDQTLITGNILPDASFESWASATSINTPWALSAATLAAESAAGSVRNGTYAAAVSTTAASGDIRISSDNYPRLLDLQGQTVNVYGWAYAEVANDPQIIIETTDKAGSTQSLASTTTAASVLFTKIALENQVINDDLDNITIRFSVKTNAKFVIWDDVMLQGLRVQEYRLPDKFRDGHVSRVFLQDSGWSDEACYDINPFSNRSPGVELKPEIIDEGTQRYLRFDTGLTTERRLRLIGYKPLEAMSADTDTITLDDERLPLLIAKAEMIFYERYMRPVSTDDIVRYNFAHGSAKNKYKDEYYRHRMPKPVERV